MKSITIYVKDEKHVIWIDNREERIVPPMLALQICRQLKEIESKN